MIAIIEERGDSRMNEDQARDAYDEAKRKRNRAEDKADDARSSRRKARDDLDDAKSEKTNLEERVSDLNEIIRFFDNTLSNQFTKDNTKAGKADSSYRNAIRCDNGGIQNASIQQVFYTDSVYGNADTYDAYQTCVKERDRVAGAIEELKREITRLNNLISDLTDDISYYNKKVDEYEDDMAYYKRFF